MSPFELKTERLTLRAFAPDDADALYAYLSDPEVVRFEPYKPFTREQAAQEAARRATDERFWAVCLHGLLIGNIYLSRENETDWELGYVFARGHWGRGYATEAARALVAQVFEREQALRVIAMCDPLNPASWRLMERLGMRRIEERKRNVFFFRDEQGEPIWHDTYIYELRREDWRASAR